MDENRIGDVVIAAAMRVHSIVGPGLLESAYEVCLRHELGNGSYAYERKRFCRSDTMTW